MFKVKGCNDEVTTCDCCGRTNLKRTVALEYLDSDGNGTGEIVRYGVDCAARATGWKRANIDRKIYAAQSDELREARRNATPEARMEYDRFYSENWGKGKYLNGIPHEVAMAFFK